MESITTAWVVLLLALAFSILLTPFSMHVARRLGAVDVPCKRSVHTVSVPRLGGLGIFLSLVFAAAFYVSIDPFVLGFFVGLLTIVLTGLIDDINPLSHRFKFAGEILAVVAFIAISGSELAGIGNILGIGDISFGPLSFIVTVFCMVGLINAMNLADGLDGLAGGLAVIASLFFAFLAYETGQGNLMVIALALAGALLGFLLYNGFPARLFMGDVGSLMIGYCCAVLAVQVVNAPVDGFVVQPITIALILAVPLLDTIIVMTARVLNGSSPFLADNTHLHHRLLSLGLSQNQAVSVIYLLMGLYCSMAVMFLNVEAYWQFYAAVLMTVAVYGTLALFRQKPYLAIRIVSILSHKLGQLESLLMRSLFDVNRHYSRLITYALMVLALLPLPFLGEFGYILMSVAGGTVLAILLLRAHGQRIKAILHGFLHLLLLATLFAYYTLLEPLIWGDYLSVVISLIMGWVVLTMLVGHTRKKITLHSFEILLIIFSWCVFFIVMPMVHFLPAGGEDIRIICVYAIPLLLICKLCLSAESESIRLQVKPDGEAVIET